jgi:glycosyltransferase involved in cell wall biosynthesis
MTRADQDVGQETTVRPVTVVVCVISHRRPQGLARLLAGLDRQSFTRAPAPEVAVLVVDNDPEGSAASVCAAAGGSLRFPLEYRLEPRRGIPYARNAAVRHVGRSADFLAFVDDDEVPEPGWLEELLAVQSRHRADVVSGPVLPHFESPPPRWILRGGFFERVRHPTGSALTVARTNNVLIRTSVFEGMEQLFDERLALTGGSDTHFFVRVWRAGYKLIWADEAVIHEWVAPTRVSPAYVLRRGFRLGNTRGICERDLGPSQGEQSVGSLRATWWIAKGLCLLPLSILQGPHAVLRSVRGMCAGAGYFAGRVGLRFEEYQRTDGS